ncbi:uncharacterized protein LOC127709093 [Mytilus californianus]|uniref:uncharacterized protein LOC127709093 n=1 Tax=Mytilus californianus TaxID=6549 RepID=UPI0022460C4A|nr:uncharacterized protein LOC127709093 [Mytilus californianus]
MLVLVILQFGFALGTSWSVPKECYPVFSCSYRFLDVEKFFYDGDALKDVSAETVDELCQHLKKKSVCKEAEKCKEMDFVTEMMAEIERAVCVEYKKDIQGLAQCYNEPQFRSKFMKCVQDSFIGYNQNTCGFVDSLKGCASIFQQCEDQQHASAVQTMLGKYGTTICNHHKFNIGAP